MKKKIVALGMVAVMALSAAGCGNKYVKLCEYKNMKVDYYTAQTEVTDEDVDSDLTSKLESLSYKAKDNYKAKSGDTVNIDYKGLLKGKAFEGGTGTGFDLKLGSNSFIPGFEDGLIGAKKGEKRSLNLKFPDDYSNSPDLAGKKVVFEVTVNYVTITPSIEEIDDAYVKKNIDGFDTLQAYKDSLRKELEENLETTTDEAKRNYVWQKILDDSEIKEYPEKELDKVTKEMKKYYETSIQNYYGVDLATYLKNTNTSEKDFDKEIEGYAKDEEASRLITNAIAEKEKLVISDDDYEKELQKYCDEYNIADSSTLTNQYSEDTIRAELQRNIVLDFVMKTAECTYSEKVKPTEAPAN